MKHGQHTAKRKAHGERGASKTILLVDDSQAIRIVYTECLTRAGFRVVQAHDAKSAKHILKSGVNVDLLLTDFQMPGMSGAELAQWFQQHHPGIPILLISAPADHVDFAASALPTVRCKLKPTKIAELVDAVAQLVLRDDARRPE